MYANLKLDISETPEKYRLNITSILQPLIKLLRDINKLEDSYFALNQQKNQEKLKQGIPAHQCYPGWKQVRQEYRQKYFNLIKPLCSEKLLKRGYALSLSKPNAFFYVNTDCKLKFIMKSAHKASVIFFYEWGIAKKDKFVLRNIDGQWKIDEFYYGFPDQKTWHIYNL